MNFGPQTAEGDAHAIMERTLESGINFFDTANACGRQMGKGYTPRTVDQLAGSLRALQIKLGQAELSRLDEIWPGPGGEAPEAYAW